MARDNNAPWLKAAILSALSFNESNSQTLLPSKLFRLQCSPTPTKGSDPIIPLHAFLSDQHTHVHAVISVNAIKLFGQRLEQAGIGMLSQALVALKHYTLMLQRPNHYQDLPKLLIMVDELNFISPCRPGLKTSLLDDDEEIAARIRYIYHDFFRQSRPSASSEHQNLRIDPDAIQLIVQNSHKSTLVPGWSEISRPGIDDDQDNDSIESRHGHDVSPTSSPKPSLQLLSPEKPIKSSLINLAAETSIEPSESDPVTNTAASNRIEKGDMKDGDRDLEGDHPVHVDAGQSDSCIQPDHPTYPEVEIVDIEEDEYLNGIPVEIISGDFNPGFTQFGFDDFEDLNLVELPMTIDLTTCSGGYETDTTSIKVNVKQEILSPDISKSHLSDLHQISTVEPIEEIAGSGQTMSTGCEAPAGIKIQELESDDVHMNKSPIVPAVNNDLPTDPSKAQDNVKELRQSFQEGEPDANVEPRKTDVRQSTSITSESRSTQNSDPLSKKSGTKSRRGHRDSSPTRSDSSSAILQSDFSAKKSEVLKTTVTKPSVPRSESIHDKNTQMKETWRKLKSSGVLKAQTPSQNPVSSSGSSKLDRAPPKPATQLETIEDVVSEQPGNISGSGERLHRNGSIQTGKTHSESLHKASSISEAQAYANEISRTRSDVSVTRPEKKQRTSSISADVHCQSDNMQGNQPTSSNTKTLTGRDLLLATLKYTTARFKRRRR